MKQFINSIKQKAVISEALASEIQEKAKYQVFPINSTLLKIGAHSNRFIFIKKGLVKMSCLYHGESRIMKFFTEGEFITYPNGFFYDAPSEVEMVCCEETETIYLDRIVFLKLCDEEYQFECLNRKLLVDSYIELSKESSVFEFGDAFDRYDFFLKNHERIALRVKLKDIANHLGMTNVNLSRLRARFKKNRNSSI